jgi:hypothetical protein
MNLDDMAFFVPMLAIVCVAGFSAMIYERMGTQAVECAITLKLADGNKHTFVGRGEAW